jgi:hypothetical protein
MEHTRGISNRCFRRGPGASIGKEDFSAATPLISTSQSTKQPELRFRPLLSANSSQDARFERVVVG